MVCPRCNTIIVITLLPLNVCSMSRCPIMLFPPHIYIYTTFLMGEYTSNVTEQRRTTQLVAYIIDAPNFYTDEGNRLNEEDAKAVKEIGVDKIIKGIMVSYKQVRPWCLFARPAMRRFKDIYG